MGARCVNNPRSSAAIRVPCILEDHVLFLDPRSSAKSASDVGIPPLLSPLCILTILTICVHLRAASKLDLGFRRDDRIGVVPPVPLPVFPRAFGNGHFLCRGLFLFESGRGSGMMFRDREKCTGALAPGAPGAP